MNIVRPITDLQENFTEISSIVLNNNDPVLLENNNEGDMVILSKKSFEEIRENAIIDMKLEEAQASLYGNGKRYTQEEMDEAIELMLMGDD